MGGYMYADENGNPTFDGIVGKPRCYVCARRYPVIIIRVGEEVHKIVHCSANCPYRHPESYQGILIEFFLFYFISHFFMCEPALCWV
jgi:hypothetical protein